jgi:hypothetical protein
MNELIVIYGDIGRSLNAVTRETYGPSGAMTAYNDQPASPGLVAKARAAGLPADAAELACGVLTKVITCLDGAAKLRRGSGYARAKLIETALHACRPPVSDALRVAMVACPIDGRAMLRLWCEVADYHERGVMLDLLRDHEIVT